MTAASTAMRTELPWLLGGRPLRPDRGGYTVTMREDEGTARALAALRASRRAAPCIHVGWGSFRNLDIAAARSSASVYLCDINLHQFRVWRAVRQALHGADSPAAFVDAVAPKLPQRPRLRMFSTDVRDWIGRELSRPDSWLNERSTERYRHIRELFETGAVRVLQLDLATSPDAPLRPFGRLAARLSERASNDGFAVDTVYVSNIPFMLQQAVGFFGEDQSSDGRSVSASLHAVRHNLGSLASPAALLITAEHLATTSTNDNLQWRTEVLQLDAYLQAGLP